MFKIKKKKLNTILLLSKFHKITFRRNSIYRFAVIYFLITFQFLFGFIEECHKLYFVLFLCSM